MATKAVYDTEDALQRLVESLDARKNQLFDPTLLAMAEGFLSPTRSGGFGESLGLAAGKVRSAQEEQAKRDIEDAKARMEIAQLQAQMKGQTEGWQALMGAPSGAAPTGAATTGAAPAGTAPAGGAPSTIPLGLSREQYLNMARAAGQTPMDAMLGYDKYLREGTKQTEGGSWNLRTNEFTPTPSSERVNYPVFSIVPPQKDGRPQEFSIPKNVAIKADEAMSRGSVDEYRKLLTPYIFGFGASAAPSGAPAATAAPGGAGGAPGVAGAPAVPTRLESAEEKRQRESKEKIGELTETEMAKANVKETREFYDAGTAARNMQPALIRAKNIVETTPGIDQAMGVLERPTIKAQIGSLVEEALRVGTFSVGIPAIRKILTNANIPQGVIDKVAELGQLQAMWQFDQRKGLGSGTSVSNFEQQMVNAMGPNMTDSKSAYLQKLRFMENQAEFRSWLASELRSRKMQYNDFEQTKDFKDKFEEYKAKQSSVLDMNPQKPAAGAAGTFKIREVPGGR